MAKKRAPHVERVMRSYAVSTMADLRRAVRDEYTEETGERYTLRDADLMLDGMFNAAYERLAGGGDYGPPPVEPAPDPYDGWTYERWAREA